MTYAATWQPIDAMAERCPNPRVLFSSGAGVDRFDVAALLADHPSWGHPRIVLTPHIASVTYPESAARVLLNNIRRHR